MGRSAATAAASGASSGCSITNDTLRPRARGQRLSHVTAGLLLGLVLAQSATAEPSAANLDRIRRALDEPSHPLITASTVGPDGPVCRMRVQGLQLRPAWEDRSMVPPYVRTWFRLYHHEFLEQSDALSPTPDVFRSATLYPAGIPVDPLIGYLVKEIKAARRNAQEKRARKTVSEELAALLACRADATKPGC